MLTLSCFKHFLILCRTRDMKIQIFWSRNRQKSRQRKNVSRNRQKNRLLLLSHKSTRVACLCKNERCNLLAKTCLVWRFKNNFISNKSLNNGTFSRFKRFLTPHKTRDTKIQNFLSQNGQKNRLSHMTRRLSLLTQHTYNSLAKTRLVWHVKMNFISNKSLKNGTFSRLKHFLTPYTTRDMNIQNFPSRNRQNNRLSHMTRCLSLLQFARKNSLCLARQNEFHFK